MNLTERLEVLQTIRNHLGWMDESDFSIGQGFHKSKVIELAEKTEVDCDSIECIDCPLGDSSETICVMVNNDPL